MRLCDKALPRNSAARPGNKARQCKQLKNTLGNFYPCQSSAEGRLPSEKRTFRTAWGDSRLFRLPHQLRPELLREPRMGLQLLPHEDRLHSAGGRGQILETEILEGPPDTAPPGLDSHLSFDAGPVKRKVGIDFCPEFVTVQHNHFNRLLSFVQFIGQGDLAYRYPWPVHPRSVSWK